MNMLFNSKYLVFKINILVYVVWFVSFYLYDLPLVLGIILIVIPTWINIIIDVVIGILIITTDFWHDHAFD